MNRNEVFRETNSSGFFWELDPDQCQIQPDPATQGSNEPRVKMKMIFGENEMTRWLTKQVSSSPALDSDCAAVFNCQGRTEIQIFPRLVNISLFPDWSAGHWMYFTPAPLHPFHYLTEPLIDHAALWQINWIHPDFVETERSNIEMAWGRVSRIWQILTFL